MIPPNRDREFWRKAATYPVDKESIYPGHAEVHEFSMHAGLHVLEYGCGGGSDTMSFLRRGAHVTYCDVVPTNVVTTSERIADAGFSGSTGLVLQESDKIDLPDASFDVVSSHGVLHHIREPLSVVREFRRLLKPGGKLYVMLYSPIYQLDAADFVRAKMREGMDEYEAFGQFTDGEGCPYARGYSDSEGWELFTSAGFVPRHDVLSIVSTAEARFSTFRAEVPR